MTAFALLLAACNGGSVPATNPGAISGISRNPAGLLLPPGGNVLKNPCFNTGKLSPWKAVGKKPGEGVISKKEVWDCSYSAFAGTTKPPAVNGLHGIKQSVKIPKKAKLTWWYYGGSNDSAKYADDEVDLVSNGKTVYQCYKSFVKSKTWIEGTCDLSKYAGKTYDLQLGVNDNGYTKTYIYWYVDDLSLSSK
jgi:hypothetical protein